MLRISHVGYYRTLSYIALEAKPRNVFHGVRKEKAQSLPMFSGQGAKQTTLPSGRMIPAPMIPNSYEGSE